MENIKVSENLGFSLVRSRNMFGFMGGAMFLDYGMFFPAAQARFLRMSMDGLGHKKDCDDCRTAVFRNTEDLREIYIEYHNSRKEFAFCLFKLSEN